MNKEKFEVLYEVFEYQKERICKAIVSRQEKIKEQIDTNTINIEKLFNNFKDENIPKLCALICETIALEKEYKQPYKNLFNS